MIDQLNPPNRRHMSNLRKIKVELWHAIGEIVYLRVRDEQIKGMVTAAHVFESGITYSVCWGDDGNETSHYAFELTSEFSPDFGNL